MSERTGTLDVEGPWSLVTSRSFWEGFAPTALPRGSDDVLRSVFCADGDWQRVEAEVRQQDGTAMVTVRGRGDLESATAQVARFLSLDVDARSWPEVGRRDPVIAEAQAELPGLRPCGFHSPYEAAAWAVLSHRVRIVQAARARADLIDRYGDDGAFPPPQVLLALDLDFPGRKNEYLAAVAEAALDGQLDGGLLRSLPPEDAIRAVREIKGLGPFSAGLVVIRGANAPDALPQHERRLDAEIEERYGPGRALADISGAWRPFRSWAAVHLRILREGRTREIGGRG